MATLTKEDLINPANNKRLAVHTKSGKQYVNYCWTDGTSWQRGWKNGKPFGPSRFLDPSRLTWAEVAS